MRDITGFLIAGQDTAALFINEHINATVKPHIGMTDEEHARYLVLHHAWIQVMMKETEGTR